MATRKSSKKTNEKEIEKVKGTIVDDNGKEIDMDSIILTPAEYFEKIKDLQQETSDKELQEVLEFALSKMEKFKILKQTEAANILMEYVNMFKK